MFFTPEWINALGVFVSGVAALVTVVIAVVVLVVKKGK